MNSRSHSKYGSSRSQELKIEKFVNTIVAAARLRGIVIVMSALQPANLNVDHNFLRSWCIVFILGHNNPWDNTF
jgi:hypothetical protein